WRNPYIYARFALQGGKHLHASQGFHAALCLLGLCGLGLETVDEALQPGRFAALAIDCKMRQSYAFGALRQEILVAALVSYQLALVKMQYGSCDRIQELGIVRDEQDGTF